MATNTSYSQLTEAKTSPPSLSSHSQKLQEIEIKPASWACTWPSNSGAGSLSSVISSTQRLEKREGLWGLWRQQALVWDCRRKHQTWVQVPGPPYPLLLWELVTEATLFHSRWWLLHITTLWKGSNVTAHMLFYFYSYTLFKGYTPFTVITKYWLLCNTYCATHLCSLFYARWFTAPTPPHAASLPGDH